MEHHIKILERKEEIKKDKDKVQNISLPCKNYKNTYYVSICLTNYNEVKQCPER